MKQKVYSRFILVPGIFLALSACNQQGKKEEPPKTTDSAVTMKAEPVQPVAPEAVLDAAKEAPNLYKVLRDTMGIRVLEAIYKPGDSSAMHSHPDNAIYVAEAGSTEFTGKDGTKTVNELKKGTIMISPGGSHSVKNTGKTTMKVILVEVNRPKETVSPDPAMDAIKVAPGLYKLKGDTLGIRVLEVAYKPGQSSALHYHPDYAIYVTQGGTAEFTAKGGAKQVNTLKTGSTLVLPAETHSVKNTGTTTVKAILVEVNRRGN